MTREIVMKHGHVALVDDVDYDLVAPMRWHQSLGYAVHSTKISKRIRTVVMHRFILDAPTGMQVDHINHNGLDNRRCNIRLCTPRQNQGNRRKTYGTSRYKGVHWNAEMKLWYAGITQNQRHIALGKFLNEDDAAQAYDRAALEYWGEFAWLNFPIVTPATPQEDTNERV